MDHVLIEGFEFECVIGVYDWEKKISQRLSLDLELEWDIAKAARSDDLSYTLDYAAITSRIVEYVDDKHYELVETYAEQIAQMIMREYGVTRLMLTLRKPTAVPAARAVGVRIRRSSLPGEDS